MGVNFGCQRVSTWVSNVVQGGGLRQGTTSPGKNFAFEIGDEIFPTEFFLRNWTIG